LVLETRMITLSYGIKLLAVSSFLSSQRTRVTQTDGQTTDGQNYDIQDRASIAASRGKKVTEKAETSKYILVIMAENRDANKIKVLLI